MINLQRQPQETQADFCERCHRALERSIPETDRRNVECLRMCREQGFDGPQQFGRQEFEPVYDVPVFAEHSTRDKNGNLVVYDRNALAAIAKRCNERIEDTGNYPPITDGHTPPAEDMAHGAKMPDVLGYAANFRVGMIGNKNPRWAIFCDEYHHREDRPRLRKLRRRSPEVWLDDQVEQRFFDPIAALGAETPRLDMGMAKFSRQWTTEHNGELVEKYSAVAPAAASVFVPSDDLGEDDETDQYEAEGTAMAVGPEEINQIIEALMQTAPMQYLQQMMDADSAAGGEAPPEMGGGAPPEAGLETPPPSGEPDMGGGDAPPPAAPPALDDEDQQQFSRYMAGEIGDDDMAEYRRKKNYQAGCETESEDDMTQQESYSRQQERIDKARYAKMEERLEQLERENRQAKQQARQAERYSKLSELQQAGYQLDPKAELEDTTEFSDQQFEKHLDRIAEKYSRIPLESSVPRLHAPSAAVPLPSRDDQAKKAKYSKRAVELCKQAQKRGETLPYEQALEQAKKEDAA